MPKFRLAAPLAAAVAVLSCVHSALAQQYTHTFEHQNYGFPPHHETFQEAQPFKPDLGNFHQDMSEFNPDFQWFAPALFDEYGGEPIGANVGWFATYDRVYFNVTRPNSAVADFQGDFTWGNRIQFGYMTDKRTGWHIGILHVDGPNIGPTADVVGFFDEPTRNQAKVSGFELNRVWRFGPYHHGAYLDLFVGARYYQVDDRFQIPDTVLNLDTDGDGTVDLQRVIDDRQFNENDVVGAQIGFRYFHQRGRWVLSAEARGFAARNFQKLVREVTTFDTDAAGTVDSDFDRFGFEAEEFVAGSDVRLEAAYYVTREVSLRFGWAMTHFASGIYRGHVTQLVDNEENMLLTGLTFGVALNR